MVEPARGYVNDIFVTNHAETEMNSQLLKKNIYESIEGIRSNFRNFDFQ